MLTYGLLHDNSTYKIYKHDAKHKYISDEGTPLLCFSSIWVESNNVIESRKQGSKKNYLSNFIYVLSVLLEGCNSQASPFEIILAH